jgi:glycosyltransferase involved in cell wall biosynthesis
MRVVALTDLPSPPPGVFGWPWTEDSPPLPDRMPDGRRWPRVSVVTPSFNQGPFIEETIRSVLLQGYPNLEYVVIDGGSQDDSVSIIRKYEKWLARWSSEPDSGQVHAIDKGWSTCSGEVLAYLNSDDAYLPGAVGRAMQALGQSPASAAVCGSELRINREGFVLWAHCVASTALEDLLSFQFIPQPAVFLRRSALERAGGLDRTFQMAFDYELWLRLANYGGILCIPEVLAVTRMYDTTKTATCKLQIGAELERVIAKVLRDRSRFPLSTLERRRLRAHINYLRTTIYLYLDNPLRKSWQAVASGLRAATGEPALAWNVLRMFARRIPRAVIPATVRRRLRRGAPRPGDSTGIHWADWQPGCSPARSVDVTFPWYVGPDGSGKDVTRGGEGTLPCAEQSLVRDDRE